MTGADTADKTGPLGLRQGRDVRNTRVSGFKTFLAGDLKEIWKLKVAMSPGSPADLVALDMRRRRAVWRASHRGTRELDILVGSYAEKYVSNMADAELETFENFLCLPDPDLQRWLLTPGDTAADELYIDLVAAVRRFHGLI